MINKDIENKVLKDIKESLTMPDYGFIAGQFVASLFYKHLGLKLEQPIKDIDIFQSLTRNNGSFMRSNFFRNFSAQKAFISEKPSLSENTPDLKTQRSYGILDSKMTDNHKSKTPINIIRIKNNSLSENSVLMDYYLKNKQSLNPEFNLNFVLPMDILNSFDLNCCAVGYSIEDGKFYYTSSFLDFLKNHKLRVQSLHSPHATLVRLHKKIKDIKCNSDIDKEHDLIFSYIECVNSITNDNKLIIGKPFKAMFAEYKNDFLEKHLTLKDRTVVFNCKGFVKDRSFINKIKNHYNLELLDDKLFIQVFYSKESILNPKVYEEFSKYLKNTPKEYSYDQKSLFYSNIVFYWIAKIASNYSLNYIDIDNIKNNTYFTKKLSKNNGEVISIGANFNSPEKLEDFCKLFFRNNKIDNHYTAMFKHDFISYEKLVKDRVKEKQDFLKNLNYNSVKSYFCIRTFDYEDLILFDIKYDFDSYWLLKAQNKKDLRHFDDDKYVLKIFNKFLFFSEKDYEQKNKYLAADNFTPTFISEEITYLKQLNIVYTYINNNISIIPYFHNKKKNLLDLRKNGVSTIIAKLILIFFINRNKDNVEFRAEIYDILSKYKINFKNKKSFIVKSFYKNPSFYTNKIIDKLFR